MPYRLFISLFFILFFWVNGFAQELVLDSVKKELNLLGEETKEVSLKDTSRIFLYLRYTYGCSPDEIVFYCNRAANLCDRLLEKEKNRPAAIFKKLCHNKAFAWNQMGVFYEDHGDIKKALECGLNALELFEQINDKNGTAQSLNNLGLIYHQQGDPLKAMEYYKRSLKLCEETGEIMGKAYLLANMAYIMNQRGFSDTAMNYYQQAFEIHKKIKNARGQANTLNSMGTVYKSKKKYTESLKYYFQSVAICRAHNEKRDQVTALNNIAGSNYELKKFDLAKKYSDTAIALARSLHVPTAIRATELIAYKIDSASGNFNGAYQHFKQHILFRDSIQNESTRKASLKSQLRYEFDKKEAVLLEKQEKEKVIAEEKNHRQQIIICFSAAGLLLVIVFAFFVFKSLKTTRKQKLIIEEHQKEILDSIRYAKRIQTSLLPTNKYIERILKSSAKI